jgi:hypothetical protein
VWPKLNRDHWRASAMQGYRQISRKRLLDVSLTRLAGQQSRQACPDRLTLAYFADMTASGKIARAGSTIATPKGTNEMW